MPGLRRCVRLKAMFRRKSSPTVQPLWLIVGLGNPGGQYRGTRHNVGFDVIELLADRHRIKLDKSKYRSRFGLGQISDTPVALVKPLTFMNLSGQSIAPLSREFQIGPSRILVVADDLDLPTGKIRLRSKGSAGGHNGHKSLIASLGTLEYPRIKIGIGSVDRSQTVDHVLGAFSRDELPLIRDAISDSADGVELVLLNGIEAAMSAVNVG